MILGLITFAMLALLAALALIACAPTYQPSRYLLPAVRTVALITTAAVYVAALFR
ncbi:hypothetical protein J7I98_23690 [Streptomyces sp. ISL-98]|uniref:hypothetical protein n=1 Tax=Streptomyces sp. ISL-98 TaxID=2819192 RepID=UPI001BE9568F|nr:hypothetical protein [Streptomyces sp. ISL-98]MBT2508834.1 hypothetical protein [Streptomyces sp. ISL-98]